MSSALVWITRLQVYFRHKLNAQQLTALKWHTFTISHITNQLPCTKIHHTGYDSPYVYHDSLCIRSDAISLMTYTYRLILICLLMIPYTYRHLGSRGQYTYWKKNVSLPGSRVQWIPGGPWEFQRCGSKSQFPWPECPHVLQWEEQWT